MPLRHDVGAAPTSGMGDRLHRDREGGPRAGGYSRLCAPRRAPLPPQPCDRPAAVGASFAEIGQLLRHRSIDSTRIYAKLDIEKLRELSLPWPGGVQRFRTALERYVGMRRDWDTTIMALLDGCRISSPSWRLVAPGPPPRRWQ